MNMISETILEYKSFLMLEKKLSNNTTTAYLSDIKTFIEYIESNNLVLKNISKNNIDEFFEHIDINSLSTSSRARKISSLRSFFNYLMIYDKIDNSPMEKMESPKIGRHIPDVVSLNDIILIYETAKKSTKKSKERDIAIIDTLFSTGIRVSELISLKINNLYIEDGYLSVIGKGNKERLVPIGKECIDNILAYRETVTKNIDNSLFLNNRGKALTREMVFTIIKKVCIEAGIKKSVSPHTFRHTYATQLVTGGVDIRLVQDILGHESITTTEIYTHLDTSHKRVVLEEKHPLSKKNDSE